MTIPTKREPIERVADNVMQIMRRTRKSCQDLRDGADVSDYTGVVDLPRDIEAARVLIQRYADNGITKAVFGPVMVDRHDETGTRTWVGDWESGYDTFTSELMAMRNAVANNIDQFQHSMDANYNLVYNIDPPTNVLNAYKARLDAILAAFE